MSQNAATAQIVFPKEGYYLYHDGQNVGPLTQEGVMQKFESGAIARTTPMWFPGLNNWITVADLPDLDRRKHVAGEVALPEKGRPDDLIVQLKGTPVALRPQSVKALIAAEDFRRTDLAYDENAKNWIRADQHISVRFFFSMPGAPSPLPPVAEAKPSEIAQKTKPAPEAAKPAVRKWLLQASVVVGLIFAGTLIWFFYPTLKQFLSFTSSPATLSSPATFITLPIEPAKAPAEAIPVLDETPAQNAQ
ncbi:MAG TPA: DUF4339 domain-containing protein [Bdellovibrionales bacterium]|nr:DUF4339 domain-containing protein [Bdellovibrionales bacterium]